MTNHLRNTKTFVLVLSAWSVAAGCAIANPGAPDPSWKTRMERQLQMDRQLVAQGSLPPSVLEIDAELVKVPPGSPRAIQLLKQQLALTQQHADRLGEQQESAVREQHDRLRMIGALTAPPQRAVAQPQAQEQRMCSVSNGQFTALQPC